MPCNHVKLPAGVTAIICSRSAPPKRCSVCGGRSSKLCDFPLTGEKQGKTCDRPLCAKCAVHRNPDADYCPPHANLLEAGK